MCVPIALALIFRSVSLISFSCTLTNTVLSQTLFVVFSCPQMPPPHPQQQEAFIDTFNQMNLSGGINQYPGGANQFPPGGGNPYQGANNSYSGGSNNPYPGGGGGPYPTGTNQMADGSMDQRTMHLLSEFSNTMMVLTTLPANVRDYLSPLCDKLRQADTPQILQMVIEILYQQVGWILYFL